MLQPCCAGLHSLSGACLATTVHVAVLFKLCRCGQFINPPTIPRMYCQHLLTMLATSFFVPATIASPSPFFRFSSQHSTAVSEPHSGTSNTGSSGSPSNTDGKYRIPSTGRRCGAAVDMKRAEGQERVFKASRVAAKSAKAGPVLFQVHFHIIAANKTVQGGWITDETVAKQLQVLNDAYDLAMFDFKLVNTTRSIDPDWFSTAFTSEEHDTPKAREVKGKLRQGDASTLNIYTSQLKPGGLGFSTFPIDYESEPELDGVVIHFGTVPDGPMEMFDFGQTATHEVGHWLGLYHTFHGESCEGPGDYVYDTPQQAKASDSCKPSDSCTGLPGGDMYTNFMDYSPDECLSEFTTGQIRRMREEIRTYRGLEA